MRIKTKNMLVIVLIAMLAGVICSLVFIEKTEIAIISCLIAVSVPILIWMILAGQGVVYNPRPTQQQNQNMSFYDWYLNKRAWLSDNLFDGVSFDWKAKVLSPVAVIILVILLVKYGLPVQWQIWAWTWSFWISIIAIYLSVMAFGLKQSGKGFVLAVVALLSVLFFYLSTPKEKYAYFKDQHDSLSIKDEPWVDYKKTEDKSSNNQNSDAKTTSNRQFERHYSGFQTHLRPYEVFEFESEANTEFKVIGTNDNGNGKLVQYIKYDKYKVLTTRFEPEGQNLKFKPSETITLERVTGSGDFGFRTFMAE